MAHIENKMVIVSDSEDSQSEEDIFTRHSRHIQSRDTGFNVHSVAIGSSRMPTDLQNGRLDHDDQGLNSTNMETYGSTTPSGLVRMEVAENVIHFSDFENVEMGDSRDDGVAYRHNGCPATDPTELERNKVFKEKKKNTIINILLLGLIIFFQTISFELYYMDMLLLNIGDISTQHTTYVILLMITILSIILSIVAIEYMGYKWVIFIGCIGGGVFTFAKFFGTMPVIVPLAIVTGLAVGPSLVASLAYMVELAKEYSSLSGKDEKDVLCYFNALLNTSILLAPTFSALLRYTFLSSEGARSFHDTTDTACTKDFCWTKEFGLAIFEQDEYNRRDAASDFKLQALLGCFMVCSLGGAFLTWLHTTEDTKVHRPAQTTRFSEDDLDVPGFTCPSCKCTKVEFDKAWLLGPMKKFCDANMMLIMPMCVYLGVQQYFIYSIFFQTYSQCSSHLFHALVMAIDLSLVAGCCSMPLALIISHIGKVKVILPALGLQLVMLIVTISVSDMTLPVQYVITAFWGAADAMIHNTIIVICTDIFPGSIEATFICLRVCQVIGYLLITTLQLSHLCNEVIIIFSMCILSLAALCYVAMEIKLRLEKRESLTSGSQYVPLLRDPSWLPDVNPVEVRRERTSSLSSRIPSFD